MSTKQLISTGASLALVLVLAGAGCSGYYNTDGSANTGQTETDSSGSVEVESDTSLKVPAPGFESVDEMRVEGDGIPEETENTHETEPTEMENETSVNVNANVDAESDLIVQPVKTFDMTARQWEFSPETITVNEGDRVVLNIASQDVTHGFAIPQFGVNEQFEPGQTTRVEFVADSAGVYTFFCSVFCGSGHPQMQGTLIVN